MAYIEEKVGGTSCVVRWRLGGRPERAKAERDVRRRDGCPKPGAGRGVLRNGGGCWRVLARGLATDDFVFVTPTGLPLRNADFYERVWTPLMGVIKKLGVPPFRSMTSGTRTCRG